MEGLTETLKKAMGQASEINEMQKAQQEAWGKCEVCHKVLMPGIMFIKLFSERRGLLKVCEDCSYKATLAYVEKLYQK